MKEIKCKCKVQKNQQLISVPGLKHVYEPLKNLNALEYVFDAVIFPEEDIIRIYFPHFFKVSFLGDDFWSSSYTNTKNKIAKGHTFCIIEDCQLEFNFN